MKILPLMESKIHELEQENIQLKHRLQEIEKLAKKKSKRRTGILKLIGFTIAGKN
ncbi:hypothetical protein [Aestuariibaculum sediminum]|uniref:Uncharacterized protein n=1 Tax=Aestuariibaculum sediminum TaxID=2770637 RepID=A0A8J6Q6W0_9FLAO|nr:hypothetical protein [Aestuariibaculum sediminum]MBD0831155.1 hypothetical protein [Aestuariibaculum sediminum]